MKTKKDKRPWVNEKATVQLLTDWYGMDYLRGLVGRRLDKLNTKLIGRLSGVKSIDEFMIAERTKERNVLEGLREQIGEQMNMWRCQ